MDSGLKFHLEILNNSVLRENFLDVVYKVIEEIEGYEEFLEAVESILELMEQNPNIDFGSPGPLVHFVEQFYGKGYEEKLVQSIQRLPTTHTVWMLNRIINRSNGYQKNYYLDVLLNVLYFPNVSEEVSSVTKDFLSLHS